MQEEITINYPATAGKKLEQQIEQDEDNAQDGKKSGALRHKIGRFI